MATRSPQLIPVSDEQVVLKRGVHQLLVSGPEATAIARFVINKLGDTSDIDELMADIPEAMRPAATQLLETLRARHLVEYSDEDDAAAWPDLAHAVDTPQWAFFSALSTTPGALQATLAPATVGVVGVNRTSQSLVRGLLRIGLGTVRMVSHPILDNREVVDRWDAEAAGWADAGRLRRSSARNWEASLVATDLAIATCDFGAAEALLEVNRRSVALGIPFLPGWLEEHAGFVGPLGVARETACLRCFFDQRDGPGRTHNGPSIVAPEGGEAGELGASDNTLRLLTAVCGRIAAMEVLKFLTGCAPSGAVGRSIEVSPRTLALFPRRVLKRPRCPDCSEIARRRIPAVMEGPQIPNR
jgi:bacteriocin biosynthesis cyclodehydratase domain-containing protein